MNGYFLKIEFFNRVLFNVVCLLDVVKVVFVVANNWSAIIAGNVESDVDSAEVSGDTTRSN